jgi:hypothetical protein
VQLKYPHSKEYLKRLENKSDQTDQIETSEEAAQTEQPYLNFGVREFFTRQPKDHYAKTLTYCKIQMLTYEDFSGVLKSYPPFYVRTEISRGNTAS